MIDRNARQQVRDAILGFMRGEIDNFKLDSVLFCYSFDDDSLKRIAKELWFTYDDISRHAICVSQLGWKLYRRCAVFLETDCEAPKISRHQPMDVAVWPFPSRRAMFARRCQLAFPLLPRYEPAIHNKPYGGLLGMRVPWWTVVVVPFAVFGLPFLYGLWRCYH